MEAPPEPHRQWRAEPAERRSHSRHGMFAQGLSDRRGARPAAVRRDAPLSSHADQDAGGYRHRGGGRPPAAPSWRDEVRRSEERRVGKEWRFRWAGCKETKESKTRVEQL